MPLDVVFAPRAERDLDEIDDLLAGYSLTAAETLTRRIKDRCAWLAEFPMAGTSRSEVGQDLRGFAIPGKATVIYRFDSERLTVLRVYYAGREVEAGPNEDPGS